MKILKLFINSSVSDNPITERIKSEISVPFEIISDNKQVFDFISNSTEPVLAAKQVLYLTENRGAFIKKCPGTKFYTCCDYTILNIGTFCNMDCSYCILQTYFHPPVLQFFVNQKKLFSELDSITAEKKITRIGTGEFTDSLIWEKLTGISKKLITVFAKQNHAVLELKTKTTNIGDFKNLDHNKKTIMAWSLNTDRVILEQERNTTLVNSRLKAALKCQSWGYPLACHFDPMFIYDGCEDEYKDVIRRLFEHILPENIVWISIGSFRFMPSLKQIIAKRFSKSKIIYGEFILGLDGKMRYFKPLRIKLYKVIIDYIRKFAPDVVIYFCMEDDEVWSKTMGIIPEEYGGLPKMLDKTACNVCGLNKNLGS